ncbi:hypothetical protein [Streptomyces triticagri]|uniref:hypothetical protein n=1 Tax=Streptomyces triticagri TaxID=2293568 RepID=UPI001313EC2F|nr:hypothetical protein [Streptomyces triticagri]
MPARPASQRGKVFAFTFGALVWIAAGVLAVVLLGHSHILLRLLTAVVLSWAVFGVCLCGATVLRRREERHELP